MSTATLLPEVSPRTKQARSLRQCQQLAAKRAEVGQKILDVVRPGWFMAKAFNENGLATLDVSDPVNCVLGRVYGCHHEGCASLMLSDKDDRCFGFNLSKRSRMTFDMLTDAHIAGIRRRRAAHTAVADRRN